MAMTLIVTQTDGKERERADAVELELMFNAPSLAARAWKQMSPNERLEFIETNDRDIETLLAWTEDRAQARWAADEGHPVHP